MHSNCVEEINSYIDVWIIGKFPSAIDLLYYLMYLLHVLNIMWERISLFLVSHDTVSSSLVMHRLGSSLVFKERDHITY